MGYSAFWQTIQQQEQHIAGLPQREAMEAIGQHLAKNFPDLSAEVAANSHKTYTLVLTAHGMTDHFEDLMLLTRSAPNLQHFDVEAFRQRADMSGFDMQMGELSLNSHDVYVKHQRFRGRVALELSFAKQIPAGLEDHAKNMAFILLDHILGEFDFAVKVGPVEFVEFSQSSSAIALSDFPNVFDQFWRDELGHTGEYPQGECEWVGFELVSNSDPEDKMLVLRNESANALVCRADLSHRLDVKASIYDSDSLEMCRAFEDRLDELLKPFQAGLCCQTTLRQGIRHMGWYVTDKDDALMKAQAVAKEFADLEIELDVEFDPAWQFYLNWAE